MRIKFDKILENNNVLMFISFFLATILWFSIAYGTDESATREFSSVPVKIDIEGSVPGSLGFSPILKEDITVAVVLEGGRSNMNSLTADDIRITANISGITKSGTYEVLLEAPDYRHLGYDVASIEPSSVEIRFDRLMTNTIPVTGVITDVTIADGFVLNKEITHPQNITISGPEEDVVQVSSASVNVAVGAMLSETTTFSGAIALKDILGRDINSEFITMSNETAEVTLEIYKTAELPLAVGFNNRPTGFDVDNLDYTIEPSTLRVAGPAEIIDDLEEISLGNIDMSMLQPDSEYTYDSILPNNVVSIDNVNSATVTFHPDLYVSGVYNIPEIRIINAPNDYEVTVDTVSLNNVTIYGFQASIDALDVEGIVAEIDLRSVEVRVGQISVPVQVAYIGNDNCWAYGEYSAIITARARDSITP